MRERVIGGVVLPGPSPCSNGSARSVARGNDKAQQFVSHHPKSLPHAHPHSTLALVPWDASTNRCARQASSMSTTREMKVQRSIGKKILAVVAGVGLAAASLVSLAPAASAETYTEYGYEARGQSGNNPSQLCGAAWDKSDSRAKDLARGNCGSLGPNPTIVYMDYLGSRVVTVEDDANADLPSVIENNLEVAPPPPCWSSNNCPVGGALQAAVPQYMIAGVPQQLVVYAAWRPDENTQGEPSNGDAVISMDGEPVAAAPFADGKATFSFTPTEPGLKNVSISGVLNSGTSGANAWIDSIEAATMVLPYDPELLEEALKNKKVEVGDTYTLEEIAQAKTALGKRLEWRVAQDSKDVCSVTTTKKGEVKAKFTESGKCSIIWTDPKTDEEGKYTFKVTA